MAQLRVKVGQVLGGRFEITAVLGGGGMAFVYEAHDRTHNRRAAIKVMNAALTRTPEFRDRFERESEVTQHAFHPHILPIWDSGEEGGIFYIASPLADTDLGALIEARGRLTLATTIDIGGQVAWALDSAHEKGVIHRDVKPENILLVVNQTGSAESYHAYLADFGIAKFSSAVTLTADQAPLSIPYASPEQIEGRRDLDGRSDQYSLACTLFDALAGHAPFAYTTQRRVMMAHLTERPPAISKEVADLPAALDDVFHRALSKLPEERYETCQEFLAATRTALTASVSKTSPEPPPIPSPTPTEIEPDLPPAEPIRDVPVREPAAVGGATLIETSPPPASGRTAPVSRRTLGFAGAGLVGVAVVVLGLLALGGGGGSSKGADAKGAELPASTQAADTTPATETQSTPDPPLQASAIRGFLADLRSAYLHTDVQKMNALFAGADLRYAGGSVKPHFERVFKHRRRGDKFTILKVRLAVRQLTVSGTRARASVRYAVTDTMSATTPATTCTLTGTAMFSFTGSGTDVKVVRVHDVPDAISVDSWDAGDWHGYSYNEVYTHGKTVVAHSNFGIPSDGKSHCIPTRTNAAGKRLEPDAQIHQVETESPTGVKQTYDDTYSVPGLIWGYWRTD